MLDYLDVLDQLTIPELLKRTVETRMHNDALCFKRNGVWESLSWKEYYDLTRIVARPFVIWGLRKVKGFQLLVLIVFNG